MTDRNRTTPPHYCGGFFVVSYNRTRLNKDPPKRVKEERKMKLFISLLRFCIESNPVKSDGALMCHLVFLTDVKPIFRF